MAITNTKLKALHGKVRDKKIEIADRDGLVIVAGLKGKVSYVFRYRLDGNSKRYTIGSYPAYSLDEAREKTFKLKRMVEDGEDPKSLSQSDERKYLADCAEHWLTNYVANLKPKSQVLYRSQAKVHFNNNMLKTDVESTRFDEWIAYFDKVAAQSSRKNAGAILKTIKSMLRYCKSRAFIQNSLVLDIQLRAVGESSTVGQRTLELDEVAKLWIELGRTRATPAIKACLKLLILFAARNSEIREAKRTEFDLDKKLWVLPASRSKTGKIIRRPIPSLACQIITELDQLYGGSEFLIPGAHKGTCMTTHSVARMCKRLYGKLHVEHGVVEFIVHDFRRTLSTRLSEKKVLPHVTEKMLGHELQGVMAVYNKHDWLDEQAVAYELWCKLIQDATAKELHSHAAIV
ncbi:tyrosine-type recombinase/integrase [Alishewanella sp. SMS9]|nr:tyrosine-type recombinase/integrase [Alishewanella sp. SMS9]